MKSQKGVTMISLILYVTSFFAVTAIIAGITTFFYNNVEILDTKIGSNSQYNRLDLYMLNECKKETNSLFAWQNKIPVDGTINKKDTLSASATATETFITFKDDDGNKSSFIYVEGEKNLYYVNDENSKKHVIRLCEDVDEFKFKIDYSSGKTVLKILININGTAFTTEYVVG